MGTVRNSPKRSYANAAALVHMIKLLQDHDLSKRELSNKLGVTFETAAKWVKLLYAAKLIYISEWKTLQRGYPSCRYAWGTEKDVPKPAPSERVEYYRKYYAKKKGRLHEYLLTKSTNP